MEAQKLFAGVPDHDNWVVGPCETVEIANEVLRIAHEKGLKWRDDDSFLNNTAWYRRAGITCYSLLGGSCSYVDFYKKEGYTLIPAPDFIAANGGKVPLSPLSPAEYWKTRCELLEKVHNAAPMTSIEAFKAYQEFLKNNPEPK